MEEIILAVFIILIGGIADFILRKNDEKIEKAEGK